MDCLGATAQFPATLLAVALGAATGALAVDLLAQRLDAVRGPDAPMRLPIVGGPSTFTNAFDWDG